MHEKQIMYLLNTYFILYLFKKNVSVIFNSWDNKVAEKNYNFNKLSSYYSDYLNMYNVQIHNITEPNVNVTKHKTCMYEMH
jgi:hypothetical protein